VNFETIRVERLPTGDWSELGPAVEAATRHLASGGLLGHPTLGVYGVGGSRDEGAAEAVSRLKGRAVPQGLVYLVTDVEQARAQFPEAGWPGPAESLAKRLWPGPLTLVLPTPDGAGIAVRAEGHPVTRAVLERWGRSMSSTSLNLTGQEPARSGRAARVTLWSMPPVEPPVLLLDAGELGESPPSTLVRPTDSSFEILRQGAVRVEEIEEALA
jgi:L-threonylcarbamoyladenylate synthase